ncbi:MAG: tetratricopeptide repeat protein [Deltaproteobacteria bacterium]|nr:tetratricopeptide repeat protein [Deltaproteobacteria bacterium]
MSTTFPSISLCMIVKDEEEWIGQAIGSVKSLVSEIIVVDTGSSDRTVQIATELGAKVLHRPWDDDFSAPRNLSIENASGDWILVLDADETIDSSQFDEIRRLTLCQGVCYEIIQRHYSNDPRLCNYVPCRGQYPRWEQGQGGYFDSNCVRLFPHHQGLHYQNRIHELVEPSIAQLGKHRILKTKIVLHHYGHTDPIKAKKNKSRLYTSLGVTKAHEYPEAWKNHFELGIEHNCNGRRQESAVSLQRAVELNPSYVPAWVNLGYVLCELGRHNEAIDALNHALALNHLDPEAHCNLGVVYMRIGMWIFAEAHLKRAIQIRPDYINAICNLGQTMLNMGKNAEAIMVLNKALELLPNNPSARADLGAAYLAEKDYNEALICLETAIKLNPELSRAHFYMGQALKALQRLDEAVGAFEKFCELEESSHPEGVPPHLVGLVSQLRNECALLRAVGSVG